MAALVISRDGDVNEFGGRVGVAERDDGDVDIGGFLDGLGVGAGVGDDDETRFFEGAGDVICEITRGKAAGDSNGTGMSGEFKDGALAIGTS